jgi:hypothetical protein
MNVMNKICNNNNLIKLLDTAPLCYFNSGKIIVDIFIADIVLNALIDTGCYRSQISKGTLEMYKLDSDNIFELYGIKYQMYFKVLNDGNAMKYDVLLGIDFLKKYKINIDFENNILYSSNFVESIKYFYDFEKNNDPQKTEDLLTKYYSDMNIVSMSCFDMYKMIIIDVYIGKKKCKALIDTGMVYCLVKYHIIRYNNVIHKYIDNQNKKGIMFVNGVKPAIGTTSFINVIINKYKIPCIFKILKECTTNQSFDLILDNNFLIQNKVIIDFYANKLVFSDLFTVDF